MRTIIAAVFATALLQSCVSKMKVTIDSFDTQAIRRSEPYLTQKLEALCQTATAMVADAYVAKIKVELNDRLIVVFNAASERLESRLTPDDITTNVDDALTYYDDQITVERGNLTTLVSGCATTIHDLASLETAVKALDKAIHAFEQKESAALKQISSDMFGLLRGAGLSTTEHAPFMRRLDHQIGQAQTLAKQSLFGGAVIADPVISLVVRAHEKQWRKYKEVDLMTPAGDKRKLAKARINKAKVGTIFGNADVAIKMDAPGTFTVKGVRVDADAAIAASFEMMQMGLKYMVYATGIPVPDPASGSGTTNTMRAMPEVQENKNLEQALALDKDRAERQFRAFLAIVERHEADLASPNRADRERALENIKASYDRYKAAMTLP